MNNSSMMMALVLMAVGCGGPELAGVYTGTLSQSVGACSDGSESPALSFAAAVRISEGADGDVRVDVNECAGMRGAVSGEVIRIENESCPTKIENGVTMTNTFTPGELIVDGDVLTVSFDASVEVQLASGESGTCTPKQSGFLARASN